MPEAARKRAPTGVGVRKPNKLSVFVSYSRQEIAFVTRLQEALAARGIEAFVDREQIENVNRLGTLTPDRTAILTPSIRARSAAEPEAVERSGTAQGSAAGARFSWGKSVQGRLAL